MSLDNKWLKGELEALGFPCTIDFSGESKAEYLSVLIREPEDEKIAKLQVWLEVEDDKIPLEAGVQPLSLLHIFTEISSLNDDSADDVIRLLLSINSSLEVQGFGMNRVNNYIYYHSTSFISVDRSVDVVKSMTGLAMIYIDSFLPLLQDVALGRKKAQTALKEFTMKRD